MPPAELGPAASALRPEQQMVWARVAFIERFRYGTDMGSPIASCDHVTHSDDAHRSVGFRFMRSVGPVAVVLCALLYPGMASAHSGGPVGEVTNDALGFRDPDPAGIGYEWTLRMHRRQQAQLVYAVGAKSWSEPSNPEGLKGWTHTSNWIALDLLEDAKVTITVERQQGVVVSDGATAGVARSALVPALSVYDGWDNTTQFEDHTYNNVGNFWSTVVYRGNAANPKAKPRVKYKAKLPAGRYSIVVGGNPAALGDPSSYPTGTCDPVDPICYAYTGLQGYRIVVQTR